MHNNRPILADDADERTSLGTIRRCRLGPSRLCPIAAAERADQLLTELRARYRPEVQAVIAEREQLSPITPN